MNRLRLSGVCLALAGFALPGLVSAEGAPRDLSLAVSVCLATFDQPRTMTPTFEKYGFAVTDDDEWQDPEIFVAQKGDVMVTFRPNANPYCMIDAAGLPLAQGQPIGFAATEAAAGPADDALYDGCAAREVRRDGALVRVAAINPGNDVFCEPTKETRFMIEAR